MAAEWSEEPQQPDELDEETEALVLERLEQAVETDAVMPLTEFRPLPRRERS